MAGSVSNLARLDLRLSQDIYEKCSIVPRGFLKALEFSGDGRIWLAAVPALWIGHPVPDFRWFFFNIMVGLILDLILIGMLKSLFKRPRPCYNKGMKLVVSVDQWSFPSGHSSRSFFIAAAFFIFISQLGFHHIQGTPVLGIMMWSIATSVSRILLGRHYVLDVLSGALLGVLEAVALWQLLLVSQLCSHQIHRFVVAPPCSRAQYLSPFVADLCRRVGFENF